MRLLEGRLYKNIYDFGFLIRWNRNDGHIIEFEYFSNCDRSMLNETSIQLELDDLCIKFKKNLEFSLKVYNGWKRIKIVEWLKTSREAHEKHRRQIFQI